MTYARGRGLTCKRSAKESMDKRHCEIGNFIVPNPLMLQLFLCKGLPTCAEAGSNSLTS